MEHIENQFAEQFRKERRKPAPALSKDIAIVQTHAQVAMNNATRAGREDAARSLERCIAVLTRMIEIETEHEEQANGK